MGKIKRQKKPGKSIHLWRVAVIMLACTLLYYLPVIVGAAGWMGLQKDLALLHTFYGVDLFGILFFAPVSYAAYVRGVHWAVSVAIIAAAVVVPYSILFDTFPNVLFKPAAFAIILSTVGAVIATIQKSDEHRRRSLRELKCLYDIGKGADKSANVEQFLNAVVEIIPGAIQYPHDARVSITLREKTYKTSGFKRCNGKIREDLPVGGEVLGAVEVYPGSANSYLNKRSHLVRTLAERVGAAIRSIELEQSLLGYYAELEEDVEKRTRELEQVQERLIRSERLAAVGELASGVGHEMRNPLNVIRNCVYLLNMTLAEKADEEELGTLKLMDKQIDIANRIVTDLLDFTRIKPAQKAEVDLNSVVGESLSWVTPPENAGVITELDEALPVISTDAEQVGRIFANIISNAYQAMNGSGKLLVSTGVNGSYAWVRFQDTGCGIPAENLEKIYEPLYTTKPKGIGLGLAITRRLVEQNGGKIEVQSEVNQGTTFTVKLPLKEETGA